jgi:hypothetical protein
MANLTAPRDDSRQTGDYVEIDAGTNTIYHGGAVTIGNDGYAHAGTAEEPFVGVAQETVDSGLVRVYTEGVFSFDCDAAVGVQANVGKGVVLTDDHTVALAASAEGEVVIGIITKIESTTSVRVKTNVGLPAVAGE